MRDLNIAIRSLFKRGRHNVTKIVSLSIGLAIGLVLIAKIYFEQSYDSFYPNADRIYRLTGYTSNENESKVSESVSAIVAPTMKEEVPGIEAATRLTHIGGDRNKFITSDKRRYSVGGILMADSCLFDVLPRPVLSGDPKKVLARPGYAMISRSFAEKLGGIDRAEGTVIASDNKPEMTLTIGGVFEDPPENSHLRYDVLVTLEEADDGGFLAWFGRHYLTYVLLSPGVTPETLRPAIDRMQQKHIVPQALQNAGVDRLAFFLKPIREVHTGEANIRNMTVMLAILAFALLFTAVMNYILIAISAIVNRSKEIALTKSYGASGTDIHRMTMSETLVHMFFAHSGRPADPRVPGHRRRIAERFACRLVLLQRSFHPVGHLRHCIFRNRVRPRHAVRPHSGSVRLPQFQGKPAALEAGIAVHGIYGLGAAGFAADRNRRTTPAYAEQRSGILVRSPGLLRGHRPGFDGSDDVDRRNRKTSGSGTSVFLHKTAVRPNAGRRGDVTRHGPDLFRDRRSFPRRRRISGPDGNSGRRRTFVYGRSIPFQ